MSTVEQFEGIQRCQVAPGLRRRHGGMSLVEVFVALLVLSVGLIALAKLQVDLVRGGGESRARTAALALAEEKVEDLRTFSLKNAALGATWPVAANQPLAWSFIANDAGGRISGGAITRAGVQYNLSWTSTLQSTDGATATGGYQSFYKAVNVDVGWTGPDGVAQTASLAASIPDTPPGLTKLASVALGNPQGPVLEYDDYEAPQVISVPIDIGGNRHRETSKPLPDVLAQGDYAHQVTFDVVNYHHLPEEGRFAVDRRESFVTVNCRCTLEGSGQGRTPATFVLTGSLLRDKPGTVLADKPHTGSVRTSGSDAVPSQPELCTVCCRDHHDAGAQYRYNPTDGGDHDHYLWDDSTDMYEIADAVGKPYDEACRMKRVNGIFQVFEDWNLVAINAIPEVDLSGDVTAYRDYVASVVRNYVTGDPLPTAPTFSTVTVTPAGTAQLQGRAIYIDYMSAEEKAAAADLITVSDDVSFLESVPWYEINLTKLANWKLQDAGSTADYSTALEGETCRNATQAGLTGRVACVSSEAVRTEEFQQDNYNRGLAKGGPVTGTKDAQAYLLNGNTGLIDTRALTPTASLAPPIVDEIPVSNDAGSAVSGSISKLNNGNPSGNPWSNVTCNYTAGGPPSHSCGAWTSGSGAHDPRTFSFNVPTDTAVVVTVSFSGGVVCPSSQSVTAPASGLTFTLKSTGSTCP